MILNFTAFREELCECRGDKMTAELRMQSALTPTLSPGEREERSRPDCLSHARLDLEERRHSSHGFTSVPTAPPLQTPARHPTRSLKFPLSPGERVGVRANRKRFVANI